MSDGFGDDDFLTLIEDSSDDGESRKEGRGEEGDRRMGNVGMLRTSCALI